MGAFVRNCWYIAAWADEIDAGPFARTVLDEPLVIYRGGDGGPVVLEDRCCHRALPLSMGTVIPDGLQCGYHGLVFDETGCCIRVPGQAAVPPGAKIKSYPAVEKWRWIWVWMGDPDLADENLVPDFHWLDDPGWVAPTGQFHLKSNYQNLVDNLLDFSHLQFVHQRTIGTDAIADIPSTVTRDATSIDINRWILDNAPPALFQRAGGFNGNVDRWMNCRYTAPSSVVFDIGCAEAGSGAVDGDRSRGIEIRSLHGITPETGSTTHYFWGYARNFALDDDGTTALLHDGAKATFSEDVDILEHQQRALDRLRDAQKIDINGDAAPLQGRRIVSEMISLEAGTQT